MCKTSPQRSRNIDLIKGSLVLVMVLFHAASSSGGAVYSELLMQKLGFIQTAFVAISGFLVGWHYLPAFAARQGARTRLYSRGAKLIGILICLNVLLYAAGVNSMERLMSEVRSPGDVLWNFIFSINGSLVSFEILYPIALVLIMGALLGGRLNSAAICAVLFAAAIVFQGSLLRAVFFGALGLWIGDLAASGRAGWFERLFAIARGVPFIAGLIIYLSFIDLYGATSYTAFTVLLLLETVLWFSSILSVLGLMRLQWLDRLIVLLGRYTLPAYIGQMLVIRIVYRLMQGGMPWTARYAANIACTVIIMALALWAFDRMRARHGALDRLYRLVFA